MSERAKPHHVLLIEDDEVLATLLARLLRGIGCDVQVIDACEDLPPAAVLQRLHLVLADVNLAGRLTGFDALRLVHEQASGVPVVLMTAMAEVEDAMRAMSQGADDYLPKPIDVTELKAKVRDAIARRELSESEQETAPASLRAATSTIVGSSHAMVDLYKTVALVARTKATVLIVGESGSGKELVARRVHDESPRAKNRFVAVNCAAITESLLESELFGFDKGAFTGAAGSRRGLFEEADGATLFLDEIGEVSPKMQAQMLRALQEGEIRRVGGSEPIRVDVRVIAATNRDLDEEVKRGRFRQDLFFRLHVVTLRVPPLRERRGDIPALVQHMLARHSASAPPPRISNEAMEILKRYDYPGNARELSHIIERAILFVRDGVITAANLPAELTSPAETKRRGSLDVTDWPTVAELTRRYVDYVLAHESGNKTRASEVLGLNRRTLLRMSRRGESEPKDNGEDDAPSSKR